jgi:hypothetical protein
METGSPDFEQTDEPSEYALSEDDHTLIEAARSLLWKVMRSDTAQPAQLVSVAKLSHALTRLPRVTDGVGIHVSVCGPRRNFDEIETFHWWEVTLDCGHLSMSSGGHFYQPSTGGDTFTTMEWSAYPGEQSTLKYYGDKVWMVPDLWSYAEGVARVNFAAGGHSVEVMDDHNPLLGEMVEGSD